jgi:DNA-binding MarR family transcriptional regulator
MGKEPRSDTTAQAWIAIMRAQQRLLRAIESDLKKAGLPPLGWYDVLWELVRAEEGKLRPFEIEERTLLAQYNLSRLIDRLEREELVSRETFAEDGRGRWVVITETGRALRERMWTVYSKAIEVHVGSKLDEPAATALVNLLARFSA